LKAIIILKTLITGAYQQGWGLRIHRPEEKIDTILVDRLAIWRNSECLRQGRRSQPRTQDGRERQSCASRVRTTVPHSSRVEHKFPRENLSYVTHAVHTTITGRAKLRVQDFKEASGSRCLEAPRSSGASYGRSLAWR